MRIESPNAGGRHWSGAIGAGLGTVLILSVAFLLAGCSNQTGSHLAKSAAMKQTDLSSQGPAPDFDLTNQDGQSVKLSDIRGRVVLITFFYADCPDFCPTMNSNLKQVLDSLDEDSRQQVMLLSITFDPLADTPEKLKEYAQKRGFAVPNWHFLTGTTEEIDRVTQAYGILVEQTESQVHVHPDGTRHVHERDFGHLAQALLIDQKGEVHRAYLGVAQGEEVFSPRILVEDIRVLLSSQQAIGPSQEGGS
jgi:protein SCO1/2